MSTSFVKTGAGDDTVRNSGSNVQINGGAGNDSVENYGNNVTITGGKGDDTITNNTSQNFYGDNVLFVYNNGDGNDIINGFKDDSTLSIGGGKYLTQTSGDDVIISVGDGQITLVGVESLNLNIDGTLGSNEWTVENGVAKYGFGRNVLITVSGLKNPSAVDGVIAGLTLDEDAKTVTVAANLLGTSNVTISGEGYTLALAEDVPAPIHTAGWNDLTYRTASNTAGHTLADNTITYTAAVAGRDLFIFSGVTSNEGITVDSSTMTVTMTVGAEVQTSETATFNLSANSYTINGIEFSVASTSTVQTTADGLKFNLASGVTYDAMTFTGAGTATIQSGAEVSLTGGAIVSNVPDGQSFTFEGAGTYKVNGKTITSSAARLTVTNTADGLTIGENTFAVTGDANTISTDAEGTFNFYDAQNFTVGGDFTTAININGNAADVLIEGDNSVTVTANRNGAAVISGVSNNSSVLSTGGANVISTNADVTISSAGDGISQISGLVSGNVIGGELGTTTIIFPTRDNDASYLTINTTNYRLTDDSDGVSITGSKIDDLAPDAMLQVSAAGTYRDAP